MIYRIVVNCGSLNAATHAKPRIEGVVAQENDTVARGGHLIEILTEYPERFCAAYFEEGFNHPFTCQLEIS
jgi:hypothetical protein